MKKVLAIGLMVVSVNVMASPAQCLLGWAKSKGIDVSKEHTVMRAWGFQGKYGKYYNGEFDYNYQFLTYGYKISAQNYLIDELVKEGPDHCHCTVTGDTVQHHQLGKEYMIINKTGICGAF